MLLITVQMMVISPEIHGPETCRTPCIDVSLTAGGSKLYKNVLCVCLGNICRSSLAEAVLRRHLASQGLDITVESAGVGTWHIGDGPDARGVVASRLRGYDMSGQVARQICAEDFDKFDLIAAMDRAVLKEIRRIQPKGSSAELLLFTDLGSSLRGTDIPDPYYTGQFDPVLDLIETVTRESVRLFHRGLHLNSA